MQQLSPAPQLVIPGPPGAQLGGSEPESPPLPAPELAPELELLDDEELEPLSELPLLELPPDPELLPELELPLDDAELELLPELPPLELPPDPELAPEPEPPLDDAEPELLPELAPLELPLELPTNPELLPEPEPPLDEGDVASFDPASLPWKFEPELPQLDVKPTAAGTKRARPHVNAFPTQPRQRSEPRLSSGDDVVADVELDRRL